MNPLYSVSGIILSFSVCLAACSRAPEPPQNPPELPPVSAETAPVASAAASSVPDWTGKWTGPEGTWLEIKPLNGAFEVTVSNLDGPRSFPATFQQGGLAFTRDGAQHIIRAGNGADTGMKWLADKTNCLIVMTGEGYCRG